MVRLRKGECHRIRVLCETLMERGLQDDRVKYLASGRYSDCFKVDVGGGMEVIAKVSTYREGCLRAIARAMQADDYSKARRILQSDAVSIANSLSSIINLMLHRGSTPHLVWSYGNFDCKGFAHTALKSRLAAPMRKRLKQLQEEGGDLQCLYTNISFHERFTQDLTDFLQEHQVTDYCLKCIIMHVVYTVGCLQTVMPGFRHNDLSTNNVFVKLTEVDKSEPLTYDTYQTPQTTLHSCLPGVLVAVADWDFAHCHDRFTFGSSDFYLRNERVVSGAYQLKNMPNPTYDVHFFLTTLLQQIRHQPRTHTPVIAFLRAVTGKWSDRSDVLLPRLEPRKLLQHHFFDELREPPRGTVPRAVYTTP